MEDFKQQVIKKRDLKRLRKDKSGEQPICANQTQSQHVTKEKRVYPQGSVSKEKFENKNLMLIYWTKEEELKLLELVK